MKMYICLKDDLPVGIAMNSAAHAGLMCHLSFGHNENYKTWLNKSFKKVTCAVTPAEFSMLKQLPDVQIVTESRMNGQEVGVILVPRPETEYPEFVSLLKLWK